MCLPPDIKSPTRGASRLFSPSSCYPLEQPVHLDAHAAIVCSRSAHDRCNVNVAVPWWGVRAVFLVVCHCVSRESLRTPPEGVVRGPSVRVNVALLWCGAREPCGVRGQIRLGIEIGVDPIAGVDLCDGARRSVRARMIRGVCLVSLSMRRVPRSGRHPGVVLLGAPVAIDIVESPRRVE